MKKVLSLLIAICMVLSVFPMANAEGIEDYPVLTYGESKTIMCRGDEVYLTFTPEWDGNYRFNSSSAAGDTIGRLYDASMVEFDGGDDCWDEDHDHNNRSDFCFTADLEGGVTYILGVDLFISDVIPVSILVSCGHDYSAVVTKAPTCTEAGIQTNTCTVCGDVSTEEIEALGHSYDDTLVCTRCGAAHPTSGVWSDDQDHSVNWVYADGLLILSGKGEMPYVLQDHDYWWNPIYIPNTPWLELPVREVIVGNGITNVSHGAFKGSEELEKVTLPASVTRIGTQAFQNCAKLTTINFPEGLTFIGDEAFRSCDLREVELPASFAEAEYGLRTVFDGNENLMRYTVAEGNTMYASDAQGALYNKDMTELLMVPYAVSTYTLPATVQEIAWDCPLYDCASLEAIYVEEGNPDWYSEDGVLYGPVLEWVYDEALDDSVKTKVGVALCCCPPAKNVGAFTIGSDIMSLAENAFKNCRYLTELTIPAGCEVGEDNSIGTYIPNCTALEAVWFGEGHPYYFSDEEGVVFNQCTDYYVSDEPVYLERGEALAYLPAGRTGYYAVPEGIRFLDYMSIIGSQLSAIRFPASLEAFSYDSVNYGTIEWMLFTGKQPMNTSMMDDIDTFVHMTAKVYYPDWVTNWEVPQLNEWAENLTYIPYSQGNEPVWGEPENPFTDVPADSFYAEPVAWAVEKGITTGASENSFNPNGECLRAHVVTFLWRAEGCPEPESLSNPFVDVKESDFYFKAVLWAVEKGITNGSDATHFNPFGVCNRAQVVTFLHRAKGSPAPESMELPFTDVPADAWYTAPVAWAVEKGITNGLSATQFGPNAACNRAQVVTFLYRAYH